MAAWSTLCSGLNRSLNRRQAPGKTRLAVRKALTSDAPWEAYRACGTRPAHCTTVLHKHKTSLVVTKLCASKHSPFGAKASARFFISVIKANTFRWLRNVTSRPSYTPRTLRALQTKAIVQQLTAVRALFQRRDHKVWQWQPATPGEHIVTAPHEV